MPAYANVILDTTAPAGVSIVLEGGDDRVNYRDISAAIHTDDSPTTGYQMKIWGDVDLAANADIQDTEGASNWIAFSTTQAVRLATGDGLKTIHCKIRDDVFNASAGVTDTITLDTVIPVITIQPGSPDVSKISKIATKDTTHITWRSDSALESYEVEVVANGAAAQGTGTVIPTTAGSLNTSGGAVVADTDVITTIKGTDFETAAGGPGNDGTKVIKVFGNDGANWSA